MPDRVVVTGGSRGIGLAIVRRLLEANYEVVSVSRMPTPTLHELSESAEGRLLVRHGDLGDHKELLRLAAELVAGPRVFGLVNNAGVAADGLVVSTHSAGIARLIAVNLVAPILLSRAVAKHMIRARRGRIINISSVAARRSLAGLATYGAAKAGLEGFTRGLARELGPRGITVNAVAPGFLHTDMSRSLSPAQIGAIRRRTPLMRAPEIADVASLVHYLLSDEASHLTGCVIPVDGGAGL